MSFKIRTSGCLTSLPPILESLSVALPVPASLLPRLTVPTCVPSPPCQSSQAHTPLATAVPSAETGSRPLGQLLLLRQPGRPFSGSLARSGPRLHAVPVPCAFLSWRLIHW